MRFSLLGPLAVDGADGPIPLPGTMPRAVLAVLALNANRVVPAERLMDALWAGEPPASAAAALRNHVMRLRQCLGDEADRIRTAPLGYALRIEPGELDVESFDAACAAGRRALDEGRFDAAAGHFADALSAWRGEPLADTPVPAGVESRVRQLAEARLAALESRFEAELELGRHREAVAELRGLAAEHPLREVFHRQLMLALDRCGRQAEALDVYARLRRTLVDELGMEPSAPIRALHQRILDAGSAPRGGEPVPAQLPVPAAGFVGRERLVARLCGVLARGAGEPGRQPAAAATVVISGVGGAGKTALATHVAYRLADAFPDGQLYVDLRGVGEVPCTPDDVLAGFLRELGDGGATPPPGAERAARYRSLAARRRLLIILDNARDAAQVRPLLPGAGGCAVLVTSRNRLPGLLGAEHVQLEVLDRAEARRLLAAVVGDARVAAEPQAVDAVLGHCAGLPLALRIAASRLATRPAWKIAAMAERLADDRRRLDELTAEDVAVRACFQMSYAALDEGGTAAAFCLLGLWAGQDVGLAAAASLLGVAPREAERVLEHLVDASLLQSPGAGLYRLHDLLRVYAAERAEADLDDAARTEAVARVVTWYARAANAVDAVLAPHRRRVDVAPRAAVAPAPRLEAMADACQWADKEYPNLLAAIALARDYGTHRLAWQLPTALWSYFHMRRYREGWIDSHRVALAAAGRLGDQEAEAVVRNNLAIAFLTLGQPHDAVEHLEASLAIKLARDDQAGAAATLTNLGILAMQDGRGQGALDYFSRALESRRACGDVGGQAIILANLGEANLLLDRPRDALAACAAAEELFRRSAEASPGLAETLDTAGRAQRALGDLAAARERLGRSADARREIGDWQGLADCLRLLGEIELECGERDSALRSWTQAAGILRGKGDPRAAELDRLVATLADP